MKKLALAAALLLFTFTSPSTSSGEDTSATALYLKANLWEQSGDYEKAYKAYKQILATEKTPTIYLKLADLDIMMNNIDEAYKQLQIARGLFPDDPEVAFRTGVYCSERADAVTDNTTEYTKWLTEAKESFQVAAKMQPNEQHLVAVAMAAIRLKDYDLALTTYNKLITDLKLTEYYRHRGVLYLEMGKKKEGMADLKRAADNDDIQAIIRLADIALKDNDTKSATAYLLKASELKPDLALPDIYLGEIYKNQNDYENAVRFYMQAADNMKGKMKTVVLKQVGSLALAKNDYKTALMAYRSAISSDEKDPQPYYLAGYCASMLKQYELAQTIYAKGIKQFPDYAMLRKRSAFNLLMLAKPKEAVEVISKVDELERDLEYYLILADAYASIPETNKAIATLLAGINEYPEDLQLHIALASEYEKLKKYDECIAELKIALTIDPDSATAQNFLGYLYADMNQNLDEAEKLINAALAKDPENYAYIDSKAWLEYRKGNYKKAYEYITKALQKSPEDKELLEHMTQIKEKLNSGKGAK